MNYTVVWKPKALDALTTIWLESKHRDSVTAAANLIDRSLRRDPELSGEARSGTRRLVIVAPLVFAIDVNEFDRIVEVLSVGMLPKKSS